MSLDTVRRAAQQLRDDGLVGEALTIVWHAGEPLALPLAFYEGAIDILREVLGPITQLSHSIQTNATLINDAWCAFFKQHDIRVGVSVDGPAHVHDRYRHTRNGKGTHHIVLRGMELLRAHGIRFHAIAVVTDAALDVPDAFFDFFLEQDVSDLSCNFDEAEGMHTVSSLSGKEEAYAAFITRILERSLACEERVRVRELSSACELITKDLPTYHWRGQTWPANIQVMPFALITVAWNGDFSTFSPELLGQPMSEFDNFVLGNVWQNGYLASAQLERFSRIWNAIVHGTEACRQNCAYFNYCGGGAPANKLYENGTFSSAETLYCRTMFKRPFDAVLRQLEQEQHKIVQATNMGAQMRIGEENRRVILYRNPCQ